MLIQGKKFEKPETPVRGVPDSPARVIMPWQEQLACTANAPGTSPWGDIGYFFTEGRNDKVNMRAECSDWCMTKFDEVGNL